MLTQCCDNIPAFQTSLQAIQPMWLVLGHHIVDRSPRLGGSNRPDVIGLARADRRQDFHGAAGGIVKGLWQADTVCNSFAKRKDRGGRGNLDHLLRWIA
jgi:hypothetical protein